MAQQPHSSFEVDEDRAWQERFWTVQRIAWMVMTAFIIAALFGATGKGGPLASASVRTAAGGFDYPRITRWKSDELLTVTLPAAASGEVDVTVSKAFVELFAVQSITPQPSKSAAIANGHRFTFDVGSGGGPRVIQFQIRPEDPRLLQKVSAAIGDSDAAEMMITVLP